MSVDVMTNGCGVNREYVDYGGFVLKQNPGTTTSMVSFDISSYPDVITMIYFTVSQKMTSDSGYSVIVDFTSCKATGYLLDTTYFTQGRLSTLYYDDTSGIYAGQATVRFEKSGNTLNATISNIKYANGSIIYMPSQTVYAASYSLRLYGYNNI